MTSDLIDTTALPSDKSRFAILIGINDYATNPLSYCVKDVLLMKNALIDYCRFSKDQIFSITSYKEKPITDVEKAFSLTLTELQKVVPDEATLFFYFSGHGNYDGVSYLQFHENKVAIQYIYDQLNALTPKNQFYVIDACYSGAGIEIKSGIDPMIDYYNDRFEVKSTGFHLLCSSNFNQVSRSLPALNNSVYTATLVRGMSISSLYDDELKSLSIHDLHNYSVKRILLDYQEKQTPFQFSKVTGYVPFSFHQKTNYVTRVPFEAEIKQQQDIYKILDHATVHLPVAFKRDLSNFISELSNNLYTHNRSRSVELKISGNLLEILDDSRSSFDPFTASKTEDGNGVVVYQLFLKKYGSWIKTSYSPGSPNVISLELDPSIFSSPQVNPCHIKIEKMFMINIKDLNEYDFDENCKDIVIDISKPSVPLSFIVRGLFDYLLQHTKDYQLIILKMDQHDMQRDYVMEFAKRNEHLGRIMVI